MTYQPATVDHLAQVAVELTIRIRDEDPRINAVWLRKVLPDPRDWFRLAFVMAAAIPDDKPWLELTAWVGRPATARAEHSPLQPPRGNTRPARRTPNREVQPCGTRAAAQRHRRRGEQPCKPCHNALIEYQSNWKKNRKAAA